MVLEIALDVLVIYDPARGRDVALFHGEHDVVLQRLRRAFDQDVVGGEPGGADAKAPAAHHVLYLVSQAPEALRFWDGSQISLVSSLHPGPFGIIELTDPRTAPELPLEVIVDQGQLVEQVDAGVQPGLEQYFVDLTVRGLQPQGILVVAVAVDKIAYLLDVGPDVRLDQGGYVRVRDGLRPC